LGHLVNLMLWEFSKQLSLRNIRRMAAVSTVICQSKEQLRHFVPMADLLVSGPVFRATRFLSFKKSALKLLGKKTIGTRVRFFETKLIKCFNFTHSQVFSAIGCV
jgi:hypothetical protein